MLNRVGETNKSFNGQMMTIIDYRNYDELVVRFEDGTIVEHIRYNNFQRGYVKNPNHIILPPQQQIKSRVGVKSTAKNGLEMTIIAYRNCNDVDVQFEDGTIVYNISYGNFIKGKVKHPNINWNINNSKKKHIGEVTTASNGQAMTIIEWTGTYNISVKFEDGTIVKNKQYSSFKEGKIKNPNVPTEIRKNRIGEQRMASNGQIMTIINYKNCDDIDVQFEDNTVVKHKIYQQFISGGIKNPNKPNLNHNKIKAYNKWVNYTKYNTKGLKMTIIDYKDEKHITVQFETGQVVISTIKSFKGGEVKHTFPHQINDIIMIKPAYVYKGEGNFYCTCTKCGQKDVMSLAEIKSHHC